SGEHMAPALDEKFFLAQEREHRQRRSALVCYLLSQCFRINLQTDFRWTLVTTRAVFKCHKLRFEAGNVEGTGLLLSLPDQRHYRALFGQFLDRADVVQADLPRSIVGKLFELSERNIRPFQKIA